MKEGGGEVGAGKDGEGGGTKELVTVTPYVLPNPGPYPQVLANRWYVCLSFRSARFVSVTKKRKEAFLAAGWSCAQTFTQTNIYWNVLFPLARCGAGKTREICSRKIYADGFRYLVHDFGFEIFLRKTDADFKKIRSSAEACRYLRFAQNLPLLLLLLLLR